MPAYPSFKQQVRHAKEISSCLLWWVWFVRGVIMLSIIILATRQCFSSTFTETKVASPMVAQTVSPSPPVAPTVTCRGDHATQHASPTTPLNSAQQPNQPKGDEIEQAINGCIDTSDPSQSTTDVQSGANTTSIICRSAITIVVTITKGDDEAPDSTGRWEPIGRMPLPKGDILLWNPSQFSGLFSIGDNANIYIKHGVGKIVVPGKIALVLTGSSNDAQSLLVAIYSSMGGIYHGILKNATREDGDAIAQLIQINLPKDENESWLPNQ